MMPPLDIEMEASDIQAKLDVIGSNLRRKADAQVGARRDIEDRWIEDLRQYHGRYSEGTESRLALDKTGASRIFVNLTRPKCEALESRLSEMLFPSDDRNWAIQPTPRPELAGIPNDDNRAIQQQAKVAAEAMQREIDDQLTETDYGERAKAAIHDAVVFGIGILKGPVISARQQKSWHDMDGVQELHIDQRPVPLIEVVSPWDFFPDMSARNMEEAEFIFERRYITRRALRQLAHRPGYRADALRATLQDDPRGRRTDWHRQQLRDVTGVGQSIDDTTYEWWEYHGPIEREDAQVLGVDMPDDPLMGLDVKVEFVNDRVIRAELHPLDTQDPIYSTFVLVPDESTVFGYGVPYLLRSSQSAINGAWRMMLDNSALSVGPQIVINPHIIKPADGVYQLAPRKVWLLKDYTRSISDAMQVFNVQSYQPELMAIFETARRLIEQESNIPDLMQGDLGDTPTKTASGLSMAMNAANTVLRRLVKRWDDEITKTLLRRFYDYNMQYHADPSIKGDFEVDARGSSALMVKETQSQSLMQLMQLAQSPILAPLTKFPALYRKAVETLRLSPDELVYTDEEIEASQRQQQATGPDPTTKMQAQLEDRRTQMDAQLEREKIASKERIVSAELADKQAEREMNWQAEQIKNQQLQTEAQLKAALGSGI